MHALPRQFRTPRIERPPHGRGAERRSPVSVVHDEAPGATWELAPHVKGGPEGRPIVAGGGLDIHLPKRRLLADLAVGDAVHGAAARQAEPRLPRPRVQPPEHVEDGPLEDGLKRCRDGLVPGREGSAGCRARPRRSSSFGRKTGSMAGAPSSQVMRMPPDAWRKYERSSAKPPPAGGAGRARARRQSRALRREPGPSPCTRRHRT